MSKTQTTAPPNPNATGSGRHIPKYAPEQLRYVESQRFRARSPYWEVNQGDEDDFFSGMDETLPPWDHWGLSYSRLPSENHWIRVLKVEPGVLYSAVKCSLIPVDLDSDRHQDYEAISYTWGQYYDDPAHKYFDDGPRGSHTRVVCDNVWVRITISLFHALEHFRRTDRPRYLWADALCIDQGHKEEKTLQVAMMERIYRQAREVLIWVGWRDPYFVENAMHLLCWLVNQECSEAVKSSHADKALWFDDEEPVEKPRISARPASASSYYSSDEEPLDPEKDKVALEPTTLKPLVALFEARYFSRLWVFQEIALSPRATMFWGRARVTFEWVALVAELIERRYLAEFAAFDDALVGLRNCVNMYKTWKGGYEYASFFELLLATRGLKAQEPVDKVFGLLGIQTRDSKPVDGKRFVQVDYGVGKYEVFKKVAEKVLLEDHDLRCLAAVELGGSRGEGEASWVPDFAALGDVFLPHFGLAECWQSAESNARISKSVGCGVKTCLTFAGSRVDTVSQVIDPRVDLTSNWRSTDTLYALQALVIKLQTGHSDDTITQCLTAGRPITSKTLPDISIRADFLRAFNVWHPFSSGPDAKSDHIHESVVLEPRPEILDNGMAKAAYYFFQASAMALKTRCVFITDQGRLGVGTRSVCAGDAVVVLSGADVPFLLRSNGGEEGHWRLVGHSFVCGSFGENVGRMEEFHIF
jgi:hypothetical protein